MEKTKIDWCDSSWNPVTGCLHSCKYCYARSIANRFSGGGEKWTDDALIELNDRIYFDESEKAEAYPYGFKPTGNLIGAVHGNNVDAEDAKMRAVMGLPPLATNKEQK